MRHETAHGGVPGTMGERCNRGGCERDTIVFIGNRAGFFASHRKNLAKAMLDKGWRAVLIASPDASVPELVALGVDVVQTHMERGALNPLADMQTLTCIARTLRVERPRVVHLITLKAILLGLMSSYAAPRARYVLAFSGLGRVFAGKGAISTVLGALVLAPIWMFTWRRDIRVIVQNERDMGIVASRLRIAAERMTLIRGSGVDLAQHRQGPSTASGPPIVLFASRLLVSKGIRLFLEAAAELRRRGRAAHFVVAGRIDEGGSASIGADELRSVERDGTIEWVGERSDMAQLLAAASIVVLPTWYGEGVPKILLEAGAAGRPVVTTNIPGCREVVEHGITGLLIPPRDLAALVNAISSMLENPEMRAAMGRRARERAERDFRIESVTETHLEVYGA